MSEFYDDNEDWQNGEDMEQTKVTGEGITVHINASAIERIECAAAAGLRQHISAKIDKVIADEISSVVEEKLAEVIGNLAEETILSYLTKSRPRTNAFGERVSGTPITISDQIPQKVESWLGENVNPRDGSRSDRYDKNGISRLEYLINKQVRDELDVATKAAASTVTEQAKKVVAAHVGRFVAEQMIPQIEIGRK